PTLPEGEWKRLANARFDREQKDRYRYNDDVRGGWQHGRMPESWNIRYSYDQKFSMSLRLALTSFGHVGVFPEQGSNWNYIWDTLKAFGKPNPRVLNLFAYTGAALVVARMAGAEVTHVDASRPGLNWANQNMELNGLAGTRWVYEDALKFVKREARRGNRYDGIIMDPPPYGRGPEGEKWTLQEKLDELIETAKAIISSDGAFFIMSLYAVGLSSQIGKNMFTRHFANGEVQSGEFAIGSHQSPPLPMGSYIRIRFS
ncbi:MAG: class I SAM-dependent methyltransferase, partial [Bacteroidota bacterium]